MGLDVDRVILGDCTEVLKSYSENSIDCIVTDPPYGMNFMGKVWDKALPPKQAFVEMCRVLKPGALAFVMSSPRQDLMWRMGQLLEESGFELGQSFISWVFAQGFPKAYDVSKGIDMKRGEKRPYEKKFRTDFKGGNFHVNEDNSRSMVDIQSNDPISDEAKLWSGWKSVSGLKPALEVVFMVQKPLSEKTIVDNVLRWGTGAMNVDACRIPIEGQDDIFAKNPHTTHQEEATYEDYHKRGNDTYKVPEGRFSANLLVSDDALNDGKISRSVERPPRECKHPQGVTFMIDKPTGQEHTDEGGFSRYFDLDAWAQHHGFLNVPKAGTGEREYGLYLGEKRDPKSKFNLSNGSGERFDGGKLNKRRNVHPTVKPVALMAYLIELGCPPGGVVLDPFAGSGTTCVAAKKLGRRFIGIEIDEASHRIAVARVNAEPISLDQFNVV